MTYLAYYTYVKNYRLTLSKTHFITVEMRKQIILLIIQILIILSDSSNFIVYKQFDIMENHNYCIVFNMSTLSLKICYTIKLFHYLVLFGTFMLQKCMYSIA